MLRIAGEQFIGQADTEANIRGAIALIAPIFERTTEGRFFDTAAAIGSDGNVMGKYRKSSIPFMDAGRIGIVICYERHFPEAARVPGPGRHA
jgi:N-carbamoylputrescine amidase